MDRKDFFTKGIKDLAKEFYKTPIGDYIDLRLQSIVNALEPFAFYSIEKPSVQTKNNVKNLFVRPPGSHPDPEVFLNLCNSCGDCIVACAYNSIFRIQEIEGPVMNTNEKPCYLCKDYPCIDACETGALKKLEEGTVPYFGYASIKEEKCLNFNLLRTKKRKLNCNQCYEVCPIEEAIEIKNKIPQILDNCIGCGLCKEVCPNDAIEIILE